MRRWKAAHVEVGGQAQVHAYPVKDGGTRRHIASEVCWCRPVMDATVGNGRVHLYVKHRPELCTITVPSHLPSSLGEEGI